MQSTFTSSSTGTKISFGRASAGLIVLIGLMIICTAVTMEYVNPSGVVDMKILHESQVITISEHVPQHDWTAYGTFLVWGIMPLAVLLYGGSKALGVAGQYIQNNNGK